MRSRNGFMAFKGDLKSKCALHACGIQTFTKIQKNSQNIEIIPKKLPTAGTKKNFNK